jgi:hypothetical protein
MAKTPEVEFESSRRPRCSAAFAALATLGALATSGCSSSASSTSITISQAPAGAFPAEARAIVWLWGYDEYLADASATLVASYVLPIVEMSALDVEVPDQPHELIDQGFGPVSAEDARFYFNVYVDLNGDGQLCPGDLRQDFDVTEFATFAIPPTTIDVAVTEIDSAGPCEPTVPGS